MTHALPTPRLTAPRLALITALVLSLSGCLGSDSPEALLRKAEESLAKYDRKTAEIHLKNILQNQAEHPGARLALARVYVQARDERSAVREWRRALEAGAKPDDALPGLLASLFASGEFDAIDEALKSFPPQSVITKAAGLHWQGQVAWQKRNATEAAALFKQALEVDAEHHASQLALIRMQMFQDPDAAQQALASLLPRLKTPAEGLLLQAEIALVQKNRAAALTSLRQAVEADSYHLGALTQLISLLVDDDNIKEAEKRYEQLQLVAKNSLNARMMRALLDFRQNRLDAASQQIEFVLRGASAYPPAVLLGAQVALARGEHERAEQLARVLASEKPTALAGQRLRALVALARNEPERAYDLIRPLIDQGINDSALYAIAGEAALRRNQFALALELLSKAASLDPDNSATRTTLGVASLAAGNERAGFAELEKAIALDPASTRADLILIGEQLQRGQWDAALSAIDRLAKKTPAQGLPFNLRGSVFLARGDQTAARESFEKALQIEPTFFPPVANLARLDMIDLKPDQARERMEKFAKSNPKNVTATLALANLIKIQNGDKDTILALNRQAHQADPASIEALAALAGELAAQNKVKEAIPLLQQAVAQRPDDLQLLELLGKLQYINKNAEQALDAFTRIVRLKPDLIAAHLRLAELKSALGDHAGSVASFKRAAELESRDPKALFGMAQAMVREGRREEAVKLAKGLQKDQPQSAAGLILEGDLLASENRWKDAAAIYRRSLGVERTAAAAIREHAALIKAGEPLLAQNALRAHVAAAPQDATLRIYSADIAMSLKQWTQAVADYTVALERMPQTALVHNNLAWALHQLKDPKAVQHAQTATQLMPLSGEIADTLGVVLLGNGQTERALAVLRQATQLAPRNPEVRLHLMQALQDAGKTDELKAQSTRWLADFPDSPLKKDVMALAARPSTNRPAN
jgi:putative PEP-CTERM system TPR-repeat lipoprotein